HVVARAIACHGCQTQPTLVTPSATSLSSLANLLEVYADHVALSFADILHLMNRRFAPTNQPGFAQSILRLTASFGDTSVEVRKVNDHAPPVLVPGFGLARRYTHVQDAYKAVLKGQLVRVSGNFQWI